MQDLKVFENQDFGQVRTITEGDKTLFCGSDVAKALGYANPRKALSDHCKGVTKRDTLTQRGNQEMSFIPEGDVYRLIVRSKLPSAEKFEKWVFEEVLPSIRKTGTYSGRPMTQVEIIAAQGQLLVSFEREINELKAISYQTNNRLDIVTSLNPDNWRYDALGRVRAVSERSNTLFAVLLGRIFSAIEETERCNLGARVANLKRRMAAKECTYKQYKAIGKIDVVAQDKKLREAFDRLLSVYE